MMYLWRMRNKDWKTDRIDFHVTWCEAHLGSFGFGFEWNYSNSRVTNLYDKGAWLRLQFLWAEVFFSARWGRKPWHLERMRRAKELAPRRKL